MAMGLSQPLKEMSKRNIFWGKACQCLGLTTLPPSVIDCLEILGASTSWNPVKACTGIAFPYCMLQHVNYLAYMLEDSTLPKLSVTQELLNAMKTTYRNQIRNVGIT